MAKCNSRSEALVSRAVTLFPSDSVLSALRLMQQHGLPVLPVVDEVRGELVGELTEAELCRVASRLPLIPIAEVLTAKAFGVEEGMTVSPEARWLH